MKKKSENIFIPIELKTVIEKLNMGKARTTHAFNLMSIMMNNTVKQNSLTGYIQLPQNYLKKCFNGKYYEWFRPLKNGNVIEAHLNKKGTPLYCKGNAIRYRINPLYLSTNLTLAPVKVNIKAHSTIIIFDKECDINLFKKDFEDLIIPKESLLKQVDIEVKKMSKNNFVLNENIVATTFIINNRIDGYVGRSSKKECLRRTDAEKNIFLIQDNDKYYLDNIDNYLLSKKNKRCWSWTMSIQKLLNKNYYLKRNDTNNRLDNNFTGLPKPCLNIIKDHNQLVEIDLANSQFSILCWIMKTDVDFIQTDDFKVFEKICSNGTLYNFLSEKISKTKSAAKKLMMQIAFSSSRSSKSFAKEKFKELFPSVANYIQKLKKGLEKKLEKFAVFLQTVESRMFIDHFFRQIKELGIFCISKHDSLIIKKSESEKVFNLLTDKSSDMNFDCTFRMS